MNRNEAKAVLELLDGNNPLHHFIALCKMSDRAHQVIKSVSTIHRDAKGKVTTVRVTMPGKKYRFYGKSQNFIVTVGKPNWYERERLKTKPESKEIVRLFAREKAAPAKKGKKK